MSHRTHALGALEGFHLFLSARIHNIRKRLSLINYLKLGVLMIFIARDAADTLLGDSIHAVVL